MDSTKILVQAPIISKLDYCNSFLLGIPKYNIDRIQRLQTMACRLIFDLHKHDHITPYLKLLHWFQIDYRTQHKVAVLLFKHVHVLAPLYLSALIDMSHNRQLRSASLNKLPVARANTTLVHNSSFTSMGPQIWNALPTSIRITTSLETFKTKHIYLIYATMIKRNYYISHKLCFTQTVCYIYYFNNLLSTILSYYELN